MIEASELQTTARLVNICGSSQIKSQLYVIATQLSSGNPLAIFKYTGFNRSETGKWWSLYNRSKCNSHIVARNHIYIMSGSNK
jgi:hypothetical protein